MDELVELESALRERRRIIADHDWRDRDAAGHLAALAAVSDRIREASDRLPDRSSPRLRHFLDNCSYDKALGLLEQGVPVAGGGQTE